MENNSITEQPDVGVISCTGCDEDKSEQFKLHLMNKGESRKGKEMSDMVKAKRQEISAQHPGELKASPLSLHKKNYKRSAMKETEWLRAPPSQCSKTYYWLKYTCMPKGECRNLLWAISLSSTDSLGMLQAEVLELIFYALHYERRYIFNQRMYKEEGKKKNTSATQDKVTESISNLSTRKIQVPITGSLNWRKMLAIHIELRDVLLKKKQLHWHPQLKRCLKLSSGKTLCHCMARGFLPISFVHLFHNNYLKL